MSLNKSPTSWKKKHKAVTDNSPRKKKMNWRDKKEEIEWKKQKKTSKANVELLRLFTKKTAILCNKSNYPIQKLSKVTKKLI